MEYLTTYGWAFLVILITIGVLAYFGLLNPSRYIPQSCTAGSQLQCADQYLDDSHPGGGGGLLILKLRNNFNRDVNITNVTSAYRELSSDSFNFTIKAGKTASVDLKLVDPKPVGSKDDVDFIIEFVRRGGTRRHTVRGNVVVEVQDADNVQLAAKSVLCGDGVRQKGGGTWPNFNLEKCDPEDDYYGKPCQSGNCILPSLIGACTCGAAGMPWP
jgi:hypothetical protein